MSKPENKSKLSLDETVRLLGAESPEKMQLESLNPVALAALARTVGDRLSRDRGRPTDKSWDISRKVPMKSSIWDELAALSQCLEIEKEIKVAPGQLAAIALESGYATMRTNADSGDATTCLISLRWIEFPQDECEEAHALCAVAAEESFW